MDAEAAEAAGVDEADFAVVIQGEDGVSVGRKRDIMRGDQESAGHAKVDEKFSSYLLRL
jgi:hypothetical protein